MIFKVNFNPSQVKTGKQNTYVSFCEQKLFGSRLSVHCFLYKFLIDNKIINFHSSKFSYEIRNELLGKLIKCYIANGKPPKLFCKLEQLVKPHSKRKTFLYDYNTLVSNKYIANEFVNEIANDIDNEIFREIGLYPGDEPINFNSIRIQPAIDYEREFPPIEELDNVHYDLPIDQDFELVQYENAIGPFGGGD